MSYFAAGAIYFIIWWMCLFVVLPLRITSQHETGGTVQGSDPGAPVMTGLKWKMMITTGLACMAFALFYYIYTSGVIKLSDLPLLPHHLLKN